MKVNAARRSTPNYKMANAAALILIVLPGVSFIIESVKLGRSVEGIIGFYTLIALILFIPVVKSTINYSRLAFYIPLVLFVYNTLIMIGLGIGASYYMAICLCICGISCLYSDFILTACYIALQAIVILVLCLFGSPVMGHGTPLNLLLVTGIVFLISCISLLLVTRSATVELNKSYNEAKSFRTFLNTTANYLAMLDQSNEIVYLSRSMSQLAGIENPELVKGRPFIDIFPGRELKLLASRLLGRRELYEENWEFVLNGQKRYFKAASNITSLTSRGTLINLHDMTFLAERDEIAAMRDSLKIGLFFMDRDFVIQDNYSRYLEELVSDTELNGKQFTTILTASVTPKELNIIKDYFSMVFDRAFDQAMLEDINPLQELYYVSAKTKQKKIFQCEFLAIERGRGETVILGTIYDITEKVKLQRRLLDEEKRRQEEMRSIFELIQVDQKLFGDFLFEAEYEFLQINDILNNDNLSDHEILVAVYQSIHAVKSNAVVLGLDTFGEKVHNLESIIKKLREKEGDVPSDDMRYLTEEIEKLTQEKDGFKTTVNKISAFKVGDGHKHSEYIFIESLSKAAEKAAADLNKKVRFIADDIESGAVSKKLERVIKEVLMQLIRNSVAHGIEMPEERAAKGKDECGTIQLTIKCEGNTVHVKLRDDGNGLDFDRIREKAVLFHLLNEEDTASNDDLIKVLFEPGFSTAATEGIHAGRGIGLSLVKDRVRDMNGTIDLQTVTDVSTVFDIYFPAEGKEAGVIAS